MALPHTWVVLMLVLSLYDQVQTGKIIGGHEAVPHSRPYMVLLELIMWNDERKFCDGFLISDEFVLTAAHCQARIYHVHVGLHKFITNSTPKGIGVSRSIPREDFNEKTAMHDLMLLQLSRKVNFTEQVSAIRLAGRHGALPQRCMVSGWGSTSIESNELAAKLMEVSVTLVKEKECAARHAYCSYGKPGPSRGDSGGPLVCEDDVAYGVVSFRYDSFVYFGKIPDYIDWIKKHIRKK